MVLWKINLGDTTYMDRQLGRGGESATFVAGGGKGASFSMPSGFNRNEARLKLYYDLHSGENTVSAAIYTIAFNTCMTGYTLHGDKKYVERVRDFLRRVDLEGVLLDNTIFALVFGDAFIEIIYDKKVPWDLKTLDPRYINIEWDPKGVIEKFQQKMGGKVLAELDEDEIIQIGFFPIPGSPYHMSLIEPSIEIVKRKLRADEAISSAIDRHGVIKWHVIVNSKGELGYVGEDLPTKEVLEEIGKKFEDLKHHNEIVTADIIEIKPLDAKGVENVEEYYNYFQSSLVTGLMCPQEVLGIGSQSTEATASVRQIFFERMIRTFQHRLAKIIEKKLFDRITGVPGAVKIKFRGTTEIDEAKKSEWISRIMNGLADITKAYSGKEGGGEKPYTAKEMRKIIDSLLSLLLSDDVLLAEIEEGERNE